MKIKINNFKRLVNVIFITTFALTIFYFSSATETYSSPLPKHITVKAGDSVWIIAKTYFPNEDLLKKTYEIEEFNKLIDGTIYPGQELILP